MNKVILVSLFCSFLSASCSSHEKLQRAPSSERSRCEKLRDLEIHSHRGSNERPENMISAFLRAVEQGADFIELDLQVSGDNQVMVAHDVYLRADCLDPKSQPLTEKVFFRNLSLKEIKSYDCGSRSKIGQPVPGERVPTLREVFVALKDKKTPRGTPIGLNIELKFNPSQAQYFPTRSQYVSLVLAEIHRSGWEPSRIFIQSFDVEILQVFRDQGARYRLSPLLSDVRNGIAIANGLQADTVTPHYGQVQPEMLRAFHAAKVRVIPWTVNSPQEITRLVDLGVDGLITDRLDLVSFAKDFCSPSKEPL